MPLSYRIDPSAEMLLIVGVGFITQSERIAAIQTWLRDPGFRPGLRTLCDFSEVTSTPTMKELREDRLDRRRARGGHREEEARGDREQARHVRGGTPVPDP